MQNGGGKEEAQHAGGWIVSSIVALSVQEKKAPAALRKAGSLQVQLSTA